MVLTPSIDGLGIHCFCIIFFYRDLNIKIMGGEFESWIFEIFEMTIFFKVSICVNATEVGEGEKMLNHCCCDFSILDNFLVLLYVSRTFILLYNYYFSISFSLCLLGYLCYLSLNLGIFNSLNFRYYVFTVFLWSRALNLIFTRSFYIGTLQSESTCFSFCLIPTGQLVNPFFLFH